ncbi:hypothetical protein Asulf_00061 [Archaeoglobus sulfaticallidus PM70-1]|uniref:Uncharacterized protein n=1 Tax=Archaeoglobus sulfaticallidus PM70-1 TaxID=387631 RepID=N0BCZ1_9EURY|nr:hypothetical protein Asulf_00061 [Archaeoglobus sulfaticallidus PM70-1]
MFGFTTHYMLDLLLKHVSSGIPLLFPFSWEESWGWYRVMIAGWLLVVLAVVVRAATRNGSKTFGGKRFCMLAVDILSQVSLPVNNLRLKIKTY